MAKQLEDLMIQFLLSNNDRTQPATIVDDIDCANSVAAHTFQIRKTPVTGLRVYSAIAMQP